MGFMKTPPLSSTILLRSSWQTVNIGDIGHTPGLLSILERDLPDAQVILWPCHIGNGVGPMLQKAFPRLQIAEGEIGADGQPDSVELKQAFEAADFFLHGSAPSVEKAGDMAAWHVLTGKPYGVYGVTIERIDESLKALLSGADFVFCRDTASLQNIEAAGVTSPCMEFGPDATFAMTLRDDMRAKQFLEQNGLKEREFICAIPRLRYSPYYKIRGTVPTDEDFRREAVSDQHQEEDLGKLRDVMIDFVRRTGLKVLACPEMSYEMELAKEFLVDPLPDDVRPFVVWRETYWNPDEAAGVYAQALALVSMELHSPIMALAEGTPSMYLRVPTDTIKGQMWRDIGLPEWIFEMEEVAAEEISAGLSALHADYPEALRKTERAMEFIRERQLATVDVLARSLTRNRLNARDEVAAV